MSVTEIRWHARGGQGAMLAVRTLARAAINQGKFAQGMPEFGAERMGAPIRAYTRISNSKFSLYCSIVNPDVVIILEPSLIETVNVTEGLKPNGIILVNTSQAPDQVKKQFNFNNYQVYTIDATGISTTELKRPMPNTPMLGALTKVIGMIELDGLLKDIQHDFSEKFSPKVVEANIKSIKRGFEEVKQ